ncbi:MAG TPA: dephospho-CoA kinase [Ruminiclostridium sp.]|nr:dephospho-CoA kinase [Ruminiclostridium sp.]
MFVLGVTGPSGAGKSLAAQHFIKLGFAHIDADKSARVVVGPGSSCLSQLAREFGKEIINADGSLDRKKLASLAFSGGRVDDLNRITHPFILEEIKSELNKLAESGVSYTVLDAPTLFESGSDKFCDRIMSVLANKELRIKRIMNRDGISFEKAAERVGAQPDDEFYKDRSDFVVSSDSGEKELFAGVEQVSREIRGDGGFN